MGWWDKLTGAAAYDDAEDASRLRYDEAMKMMRPFLDSLSDPASLQDTWSSGYEESPYAHQLEVGAFDRGLNAAGSMGLGGSSAALSNIQDESSHIMQSDRQQYMNDMMQKYMAAMGLSQNMAGTTMNQGGTEAGLSFGRSNAAPNFLMQWLNSGAEATLGAATGGASFGATGFHPPTGGSGGAGSGMYKPPSNAYGS